MTARISLILGKTRGHRPRLQQVIHPNIVSMNRVLAVAFILFCFEIGLFLMFVPWSALWEHNFLLAYSFGFRAFALNNYVRGALSGLGFLDCILGLLEVRVFLKALRPSQVAPTE